MVGLTNTRYRISEVEFRTCYPQICRFGILMELKALEKQQIQEEHSDPPFSSRKQEIKFPCETCHPCTRRTKDILIARDRESKPRNVYKLVKLTLIFLVISPQFTPPSPKLCLVNVSQTCSLSERYTVSNLGLFRLQNSAKAIHIQQKPYFKFLILIFSQPSNMQYNTLS